MKFYLGGYFLVKIDSSKNWENKYPKYIWSVSNCFNKIYPQEWALDWVNTSKQVIKEIKQELKIDDKELKNLQKWVTKKFDDKEFSWPNVFINLNVAREFNNKFLNKIDDIKLIGIFLSENDIENFLAENIAPQGFGQIGIYEKLITKEYENNNGDFLGYELLGLDMASFHSFVCNDLGHDYSRMFGINFNNNGLIDDFEISKKALDYTISDECGAEPVDWDIWKLKEFSLT